MEKFIEKIKDLPSHWIYAVMLFAWLFIYIYYFYTKGSQLTIFEFYTLTLIPIILIGGVTGKKFFEIFGFILKEGDEKDYVVAIRFFIAAVTGWLLGALIYKGLTKLTIFPLDVYLMQLFLSYVPFENLLNTFIVAFHEELIRILATLILFNYFYSKSKNYIISFSLATIISSILFVLMHIYAWGSAFYAVLIPMTLVVCLITFSGLLLSDELFGKFGIKTFTILIPLFAHWSYDFYVLQQLSVFGTPTVMSIIKV